MKKQIALILISLFFCLFIYLFYRTEKTIVNRIFISIISQENYTNIKAFINQNISLKAFVIYALPGGLWVFSLTICAKNLFVKIGKQKLFLLFFPFTFAIGHELFQLLDCSSRRFDFYDLLAYFLFFLLGIYCSQNISTPQNLFSFKRNSLLFIFTFLIVYLAHVSG